MATSYVPQWMTWRYIRNNVKWIAWLTIYVASNIILFVVAMVVYRSKGPAVMIARGCGQCLNFNPVLMIILMMRRGITWLRSTRLAPFLPLDQSIQLHKLAGYFIVFFSVLHTLAHLVNFSKRYGRGGRGGREGGGGGGGELVQVEKDEFIIPPPPPFVPLFPFAHFHHSYSSPSPPSSHPKHCSQ